MTILLYAYTDESLHDELLNKCLPFFSPDFQSKIKLFRRWQDAQLSLLGRLLLLKGITLLGEEFDNDRLLYNEYNKPFLDTGRIRFNISHSGNITVCIVSDESEVGVDIEWVHPVDIKEFKWMMTANEWDWVYSSADSDIAFFTYWTQKEAVIKANGEGLSIDLKSFEVSDMQAKINDNDYLLHEVLLDTKYICYAAMKTPVDSATFPTLRINHIDTSAFINAGYR